jgi:hypothetical protein
MKPGRQTLTVGFGLPFLFANTGPAGRKNVVTVQNQNSYDSQIHEKSPSAMDLLTPKSRSYGLSGKRFDLSRIVKKFQSPATGPPPQRAFFCPHCLGNPRFSTIN